MFPPLPKGPEIRKYRKCILKENDIIVSYYGGFWSDNGKMGILCFKFLMMVSFERLLIIYKWENGREQWKLQWLQWLAQQTMTLSPQRKANYTITGTYIFITSHLNRKCFAQTVFLRRLIRTFCFSTFGSIDFATRSLSWYLWLIRNMTKHCWILILFEY